MLKADVRLLGKRLMVRVEKPKKQSDGGIYFPDSANQDVKDRGLVVAAGPGCEEVKVGDVVYFVSMMAIPMKINGRPYVVIDEHDDVIGVFTPPELGEDQNG